MGRDDVAARIVGGVLDGAEIVDLPVLGDDDHAAGVLAGGPAHAGAAQGQAVFLRLRRLDAAGGEIFFDVTVSGLLRHGADGPGLEDVVLPEQLKGILVGLGLVFAGKVQVDIRDLFAAVAQERLKGDVEAVLHIGRPADGTDGVRHIRAAAKARPGVKIRVLALGAAVMGRQGVDLRDARQERHDGRADRTTGADQIAMLQGVLHQLLGGHVDDVILPLDDAGQLQFDSIFDDLWWVLPIQLMGLAPHQAVQFLGGVFQLGGKEAVRQRLHLFAPGGHQIGVGHDDLIGFLLAQVRELLQHLFCRAEVEGRGGVGVGKTLAVQQDMPVDLILRV